MCNNVFLPKWIFLHEIPCVMGAFKCKIKRVNHESRSIFVGIHTIQNMCYNTYFASHNNEHMVVGKHMVEKILSVLQHTCGYLSLF